MLIFLYFLVVGLGLLIVHLYSLYKQLAVIHVRNLERLQEYINLKDDLHDRLGDMENRFDVQCIQCRDTGNSLNNLIIRVLDMEKSY